MTTGDAYLDGSGSAAGGHAGGSQTGAAAQSSAGSGNQGVVDQIKDAGGNIADQASTTAGSVMDRARDQAQSQAEGQRDRLAGTLGSTAQALRQTSQHLRNDDQAAVAQIVDGAAARIDGFARYLRERSVSDLISDVERFGRNEPGIFLTAAFGAGLFAARFLKSGSPRSSQPGGQQMSNRSMYSSSALSSRTQMYGGAGGYVPERGPGNPYAAERPQPATPGAYAGATPGATSRPDGHAGQTSWGEGAGGQ